MHLRGQGVSPAQTTRRLDRATVGRVLFIGRPPGVDRIGDLVWCFFLDVVTDALEPDERVVGKGVQPALQVALFEPHVAVGPHDQGRQVRQLTDPRFDGGEEVMGPQDLAREDGMGQPRFPGGERGSVHGLDPTARLPLHGHGHEVAGEEVEPGG